MAANLRDQVLPLSSNDDPFPFQITDFFVPEADKSKKKWAPGAEQEEIREFEVILYGCTMKGESVAAVVTGYRPYFYLRVSDKYAKKDSVALKNMMNQLYIYV